MRSTTKIWVVHVISMEFLRSLLRRRFGRAQVTISRNVGCFLRIEGYIVGILTALFRQVRSIKVNVLRGNI